MLNLGSECHSLSYDALTAHLSLVFIRYMLLSLQQRNNSDDRTIGELFLLMIDELADITFGQALQLIVDIMLQMIQERFSLSDTQLDEFVSVFIKRLPISYRHDIKICQDFAKLNREKIAEVLLDRTGVTGDDSFHTTHNYIDTDEMILRKGAIAAHEGERVLIPINMRDGSIIAIGKGNPDWNYSAPHWAGRLMSRSSAKEKLNMAEYQEAMKGIYTTSVNEKTLDEAPMAYKSLEDIIDVVGDAVSVIEILKPIYNFKASD